MADTGYSHNFKIEAGNKIFEGEVEINGTYALSDQSDSQGQTAAENTALNTLLTAVNTFKTTLGEVNDVHIWLRNIGDEGKKTGL
jgi:hypothetical protein